MKTLAYENSSYCLTRTTISFNRVASGNLNKIFIISNCCIKVTPKSNFPLAAPSTSARLRARTNGVRVVTYPYAVRLERREQLEKL